MINQLLSQQCSCIDAMGFFFGFNELEVNLYFLILQEGSKTVAELCDMVSRNQSTVYTALEKLVSHLVVHKTKRSRATRGYEYVYSAVSSDEVRQLLKERLEKLYSQMTSCLDNFNSEALNCEITLT